MIPSDIKTMIQLRHTAASDDLFLVTTPYHLALREINDARGSRSGMAELQTLHDKRLSIRVDDIVAVIER